jgi:4'-phosphopantetheinyl transferase
MPLASTHALETACQLARWQITEDEPTLRQQLHLSHEEVVDLERIAHPGQRLEWLACRVALKMLIKDAGFPYMGLVKDEYGKPHLGSAVSGESTPGESTPGTFLPGESTLGHISLSHTPGWAVAVWHHERPVGVDVEPVRDQFVRVVPRVLSAAEIADANGQPDRLAVYWCAKEAMYKLYGKRQLTFREHLLVEPFATDATYLTGHVSLPEKTTTVQIRCLRLEPGLVAVAY